MVPTASSGPFTALLDTNAVDAIVLDPELMHGVESAVRRHQLRLLWTHITLDELAVVPDPELRSVLLLSAVSLATLVPTGATVLGFSRIGYCRLGDDEEAFEAFRVGNLKHTADALITVTAVFEGCAVITRDHTLTSRARARNVHVVRPEDLLSAAGLEA